MEQKMFPEMQKKLGFGCKRLPMKDGRVDNDEMIRMVDYFLENGFNYFDTAHGYINGLSELALRDCLTGRHRREEYLLTNKLTAPYFKKKEDILIFNCVAVIKVIRWLIMILPKLNLSQIIGL